MPAVFIDGEAGTTGLEIRERLAGLPVSLISIDPAHRKDASARREAMAASDVAILCLPDAAARDAAALAASLGNDAPRLIDASSAHRVDDDWVYGFAELNSGHAGVIARARLVSNPGCYATAAIALLAPLVARGLIPAAHPLSISAVSGYSGGGRTMIEAHEAQGGPAFAYYGLDLDHKHLPEITRYAGLSANPIVVPSVGHFRQGMMATIPLALDRLPNRVTLADLHAALAAHYAGSHFVRVLAAPPDRPQADALAGTDTLELAVYGDKTGERAVLFARLDNLGKGAAGAAVQNLLLMLGLT